jgi:DNA replication protein DnaC
LRATVSRAYPSFMARPDCALCGGTGWRLVERVEANEPAERVIERKNARPGVSLDAPKLTWAVPCECTGGNRAERAQARARIPRRYEHCDFENFDTGLWEGQEGYPPASTAAWDRSLAQAKVVIEAFAKNYPAGGETGLLLMGPCGVGKTHLAVAALRQLMQRGHQTRFYDYRELLKEIQASYDPNNPVSEMGVLEPVFESEVVLIDDLGASKPSPWALETIGHILNKRYNEKRVTLLTTNYLDSAEASSAPVRMPSGQAVAPTREDSLTERLGQRVRSRLYEMCRTVEIAAPDYRREIRQAGRVRS